MSDVDCPLLGRSSDAREMRLGMRERRIQDFRLSGIQPLVAVWRRTRSEPKGNGEKRTECAVARPPHVLIYGDEIRGPHSAFSRLDRTLDWAGRVWRVGVDSMVPSSRAVRPHARASKESRRHVCRFRANAAMTWRNDLRAVSLHAFTATRPAAAQTAAASAARRRSSHRAAAGRACSRA